MKAIEKDARVQGLKSRMEELTAHIEDVKLVRRLMAHLDSQSKNAALEDAISLMQRERTKLGEELFWLDEPRMAREIVKEMKA